jgi:hypothetical protein
MESFARVIRERRIVARLAFLDPVESAGRERRELAQQLRGAIASRLERLRTEPRTRPGPRGGSR